MIPRTIDQKHFTCGKCGHISTVPEELNGIGHQMEIHSIHESDKDLSEMLKELQAKHTGNKIWIAKHGTAKAIRFERSIQKVRLHEPEYLGDLTQANRIVFECPNCGNDAGEHKWRPVNG